MYPLKYYYQDHIVNKATNQNYSVLTDYNSQNMVTVSEVQIAYFYV
jgi:hypothetical protein